MASLRATLARPARSALARAYHHRHRSCARAAPRNHRYPPRLGGVFFPPHGARPPPAPRPRRASAPLPRPPSRGARTAAPEDHVPAWADELIAPDERAPLGSASALLDAGQDAGGFLVTSRPETRGGASPEDALEAQRRACAEATYLLSRAPVATLAPLVVARDDADAAAAAADAAADDDDASSRPSSVADVLGDPIHFLRDDADATRVASFLPVLRARDAAPRAASASVPSARGASSSSPHPLGAPVDRAARSAILEGFLSPSDPAPPADTPEYLERLLPVQSVFRVDPSRSDADVSAATRDALARVVDASGAPAAREIRRTAFAAVDAEPRPYAARREKWHRGGAYFAEGTLRDVLAERLPAPDHAEEEAGRVRGEGEEEGVTLAAFELGGGVVAAVATRGWRETMGFDVRALAEARRRADAGAEEVKTTGQEGYP